VVNRTLGRLAILCIVSWFLIGGCASAASVDVDRLMADVRWLADPAREGRLATSPAADLVAEWIADRFAELGLVPFSDVRLASYTEDFGMDWVYTPCVGTDSATASVHGWAENLIGVLPGKSRPDEYVIISAHYDHLGSCDGDVYPGADDNASGVAGMLEIARLFATAGSVPDRTLVFVAYSGEESGGVGSDVFGRLLYWYGLAGRTVELNLDMLGPCAGSPAFVSLLGVGDEDAALVDAVEASARAAQLGDPVEMTVEFSDDASLAQYGVPAVSLSASLPPDPYGYGERGETVPGHPYWHTPQDTADAIDPAVFAAAVGVAADAAARLASGPGLDSKP
jgi:aminopeptidase N